MKQLTLPVAEDHAADLAWIRAELDERKARNVTAAHIERYYDLAESDRELALEALLSVLDGKTHQGLRARLHAERQL